VLLKRNCCLSPTQLYGFTVPFVVSLGLPAFLVYGCHYGLALLGVAGTGSGYAALRLDMLVMVVHCPE
jgi:hypothetical protein